jgi:hypothetical protein
LNPSLPLGTTTARSHAATPPAGARRARQVSDLWLYLTLVVATVAVWRFSRSGLYTAGSDAGYWMGVAGGVMMVLLFAYPLRKRWQTLARFGRAKWWFVVHMVLGIGGPLMVLAHSTFRVGSLNAAVALFSMLLVSGSGVAGRFLYLRIHRGLGGERHTLASLRDSLGLAAGPADSLQHMAPQTAQRLLDFEQHHASALGAGRLPLLKVLALSWTARRLRQRCATEVDGHLATLAGQAGWGRDEQRQRSRVARRAVADFIHAVLRVAQFSLVDRLFSLWHVVHIPFVYVMVLCAIAHVVAVHAY